MIVLIKIIVILSKIEKKDLFAKNHFHSGLFKWYLHLQISNKELLKDILLNEIQEI